MTSIEAQFEQAKALFGEEKFVECRTLLDSILPSADAALAKQIKLWLRKCATHEDVAVAVTPQSTSSSATVASSSSSSQATPAAAAVAATTQPTTTVPFTGQVRFEWFQTPSSVTFTFYVKNRLQTDVRVQSTDRSLSTTILLDPDNGREYQYALDHLFAPVETPAEVNIRSMKVEVILKKKSPYHWPSLEIKDDDVVRTIEQPQVVAAATAPGTAKDLAYPNSKGKDWSKLSLKEEEEEAKPEGDAALNALFKQIYGNATDDQRKAMVKSFTESNGTVLSTNWNEVGEKKVVGEPPRGMEAKPFEQ